MRTHIHIAWRSLLHNPRQAVSVFLLSACAAALLLASSFLGSGIRSGLVSAVTPFDLLVGDGGSYQMVVNTVFLQDYPTGNVSYDLVETLRADERVASAVPLGFGDNYRGYRLVGTEPELFSLPDGTDGGALWLRFAQGEMFSSSEREAVVGARAAKELGLSVGDEIVSAHGFIEDKNAASHPPFIVKGILEPCRGPYDRAIFVPLPAIWEEHGHGDSDENEQGDGHEDEKQTTAIMVRPAGYGEAYALYSEFQNRDDAEMVFPAQVVVRLLSILGQSEWVFKAVGLAGGGQCGENEYIVFKTCIAALSLLAVSPWTAVADRRVALVDFNELPQEPTDLKSAELVFMADHHRPGGMESAAPIEAWL